jgi:hypothetical protein
MKKTKIILLLAGLGTLLVIKISNFSYERTKYEIISSINRNTIKAESNTTSILAETFDRPYNLVFHGLNNNDSSVINNSDYIIDVYVEEKTSLGFLRFLPLYKPIKISSIVSYKWNNPLKFSHRIASEEIGSFDIRGNYNIFGTCSSKQAEKKTINFIRESIRKKIKADIQEILNPQIKN